MGGDVAFSIHSLLGANGGALAVAFGAGAAAGWGFFQRTSFSHLTRHLADQRSAHEKQLGEMKDAHRRNQDDCDRRIAFLEAWVKEQEDRYTSGLERQLAQARDSAEQMTGRVEKGRIKRLDE